MVRALRMEGMFFRHAARDSSLNSEACLLLGVVGLLTGVGALFDESTMDFWGDSRLVVLATTPVIIGGVLVESAFALVLGRTLFAGTGTFGGVFRALAYAYLPNALDVFTHLPILGPVCYWLSGLWFLALTVVAIRESLMISNRAAVALVLAPLGAIMFFGALLIVAGAVG